MKEYKPLGAYALILKDNDILLIKKVSGPYDGKLDLPGGTIEFYETPEDALKRELIEEAGIDVNEYQLFDANSVTFIWNFKADVKVKVHHTGIFYHVTSYQNEIKKDIDIDEVNDDSLGAEFYNIDTLTKDMLSEIAILELKKMGYKI